MPSDTMQSTGDDQNPRYGWVMVFVAFSLTAMSFGSLGAVGVFLKPIAAEFGWSRGSTAFGYTVAAMGAAVFGILWGFLADRNPTRYFSYMTTAPRTSPRIILEGLRDPYFPASYSIFHAMHRISGRPSDAYPYPVPPPDALDAARRLLGHEPAPRDNDGVVPLFSQAWGEVSGVIRGDHLDVCGHFHPRGGDRDHTDWLRSGSGFTQEAFDALWRDIAGRILGETPAPGSFGNFTSL